MPQVDTEQYRQLKNILSKMFQLDQAELDFGIYRIMNQKRKEINDFLDNQLLVQIRETLAETGDASLDEAKKELHQLETTLKSAGVDVDANEKVQELRNAIAQGGSINAMELEVYSRLTQFFKRYYKEGDFISQRRYKDGVYAIPYEGEEVKLHWANHDQYYIKTSENFKNYTFKADGKTIHFVLKEADTESNNNKEQKGKERRFKLYENNDEPTFEETQNGELNIYFTYEPQDKKQKQEKINESIEKQLSQELPGNWTQVLLQKKPSAKNKNRTLLAYRLNDYTAKNSFDYFIHKDLGTFLRRELDFYIKNEILHLDDIDLDNEQHFQKQLVLIKALKKVAHKIIDFLAQLEDFQKKLWLKKKMVLQSDYCITLDRIDEDFYKEIANNTLQIEEWKNLFAIEDLDRYSEPLSIDFLHANPYLLVDTQFFTREFKYKLLATIDNIDQQNDGLLINSENFQALNLLQERYRERVDLIYIDPPYNAKSSEIIYKNNYKHASWLTLMENRISLTLSLLSKSFVQIIAIDEIENFNLGKLTENIMPNNVFSIISIQHNPTGQQGKNFSYTHDFAHFIFPQNGNFIGLENRKDNNRDSKPDIRPLRNVSSGVNHLRNSGKNCFYPILIKNHEIIGFGDVSSDNYHPGNINIHKDDGVIEVYPIDPSGQESKWVFARNTVESIFDDLEVSYKKGNYDIIRTKSKFRYKTLWTDKRYSSNSWGSVVLNNIMGEEAFTYPKSIFTVRDCIDAGLNNKNNGNILDYFAGSGTTGHAVINLNREDGGKRKYILVEMGEYFNTVTKPRIQKVIYSDEWKNGKPTTRNGSSHMFKYMRLESYEDTLNNLILQQTAIDDAMQEDYMLRYSLEVESRESLLMLDAFQSPFGYTIQSTENNELKETEVDLVETFNYLLGLQVKTMEIIRGYVVITGETLDEKKVLIIWRDLSQHSNDDLNEFFKKMRYNPLDGEFSQIYVNGDNNIENLRTDEARWKVTLIEHEFHKRMWEQITN